jgi:hypothetical protein
LRLLCINKYVSGVRNNLTGLEQLMVFQLLIKTFIFLTIYFTTFTFSLDSVSSVNQGVMIANNRNDVNVFINGQDYNRFMSKQFCLPTGRYKIIGKREKCFPDYETIKIDSGIVKLVTLNPRPFQIHISPKFDFIFIGNDYREYGVSINLGYRTIRHYFGANVLYAMSQEFINFGLNYNYCLFENQLFIVETGVLAGHARFYRQGDALFYESYWDDYYYDDNSVKRERFRSISIGPKFMLQFGLEHVKLSASYGLLFSKKLIQSLETGFCINF